MTHDPNVAAQAQRMIRISDGEIVEDERSLAVSDPPPPARLQKSGHAHPGAAHAGAMYSGAQSNPSYTVSQTRNSKR